MRPVRSTESRLRVRLEAEDPWPAAQHVSSVPATYHREHYLANKQRYVEQARARKQVLRRERTAYLLDFFSSRPCVDCGEQDPVVLEFDHLDAGAKRFEIGSALAYRAWKDIRAEMEKCEVVCANCHRRRTAERRGSLRSLLTKMNSTR